MGKKIAIFYIFSTWSNVQIESWSSCWLFCSWSDGIWMHVWKSKLFNI